MEINGDSEVIDKSNLKAVVQPTLASAGSSTEVSVHILLHLFTVYCFYRKLLN